MMAMANVSIGECADLAERFYCEACHEKAYGNPDFAEMLQDAATCLWKLVQKKAEYLASRNISSIQSVSNNTFQKGDRVLIDRNDKCVVIREVDGVQKKIELPPNSIDYSLID